MLRGMFHLLSFLLLGSALNHFLFPLLPGPVLGLLLLLAFLVIRGEVPAPLGDASGHLLKYLPLLLVPPAVGIMLHVETIGRDFWAIAAALVGSLLVGIPLTGWLMQALVRRSREGRPS